MIKILEIDRDYKRKCKKGMAVLCTSIRYGSRINTNTLFTQKKALQKVHSYLFTKIRDI